MPSLWLPSLAICARHRARRVHSRLQIEGRHFSGGRSTASRPSRCHGSRPGVRLQPAGRGWLILKTEGALQDWARALGGRALIGVLIGIALVSLWTPFAKPEIAERWFSWPNIVIFGAGADRHRAIAFWEWRSLNNRSEAAPFIGAILLFVMSYLGLAISLFPMIVPYKFTFGTPRPLLDPGISAGGHAVPAAGHPHVHGLVLLGVSRQGPRRPRLSLKRRA